MSEITIKKELAEWLSQQDYCIDYDPRTDKFYGLCETKGKDIIDFSEEELSHLQSDWLVGKFAEYLIGLNKKL